MTWRKEGNGVSRPFDSERVPFLIDFSSLRAVFKVSARAGEQTLAARLARSAVAATRPLRLHMPRRGSLTHLRALPQSKRPALKAGDVEVRVEAIGLNFRDVLNVMGMYPGDPGNPGGDCAGTVVNGTAAGLRPGQDVFGIAWGCLQSYACTEGLLLAPKPQAPWS